MNTFLAIVAFAVLLAVPVVALIGTSGPDRGFDPRRVGSALGRALAFDPRHPDIRY